MGELNPHDLLEIRSATDLNSYSPRPSWIQTSLERAPLVVIRRARAESGLVAVGVRGPKRSERFAAFLPLEKIIKRVTPEQLTLERKWEKKRNEFFQTLESISDLMDSHRLSWGPVGSVGFELASNVQTVTESSDIDLIIRLSPQLTIDTAQTLIKKFKTIPVRVDVQVETNERAFSLTEYAQSEGKPILFRTKDGPVLDTL